MNLDRNEYVIVGGGIYSFSSTISINNAKMGHIAIFKNGVVWSRGSTYLYSSVQNGRTITSVSSLISTVNGDKISVYLINTGDTACTIEDSDTTEFSGYFVKP